MLVHVVLMKFADPADAPEAKRRLLAVAETVEQIREMRVGVDELRTPVSWDLVMTTVHDDADALVGYQTHPDHLALAGWLKPRLSERAVVDHTETAG